MHVAHGVFCSFLCALLCGMVWGSLWIYLWGSLGLLCGSHCGVLCEVRCRILCGVLCGVFFGFSVGLSVRFSVDSLWGLCGVLGGLPVWVLYTMHHSFRLKKLKNFNAKARISEEWATAVEPASSRGTDTPLKKSVVVKKWAQTNG